MDATRYSTLIAGLKDGSIVPYLGPGVLADVIDTTTGTPMPATSEQLILAMNGGRPMAHKLMYEFSRAAMNVELKRGRGAVTKFLINTYGSSNWSRSAVHDWLKAIRPGFVIDINRDTQLLDSYAGCPHTLILGCARISGKGYRFRLYASDGSAYFETMQEKIDPAMPILFKPMGAPYPQPSFIASDADYVDYITELMGGFAIPTFVKEQRKGKCYLFLGMRLNRDTERMVLSDLIYGSGTPGGWALIKNPTDKERRFLKKKQIELIEADTCELCHLSATQS